MKKRLLIIDGSSLFFRAFYALPLLKTKKGLYTNAIYGFVMMLENAIEKIDPSNVVVCFDMKGKTFRNDIYGDYKGTRQKTPSELEQQFPLVRDILKMMNIKVLESPVYEADDIAGTLSKKASEEGYETYLLTGDKDYYQLVDENTKVLLTRKGIKEMDVISVESIKEDFGITPEQFIDLKGLMGDNSDNIPGVPGVGEKTGLKLIHQFETMENLYDHVDEVSGKKLKEKLNDNKAQAFMSKKLGTIVRNVPIDEEIEDFKKQEYDFENLSNMYREFEFNSLLDRLPSEYHKEEIAMSSEENFVWDDLEIDEIIKNIKSKKSFSFKIITDGKIYENVEPLYLVLKAKDENPNFIKLNNSEDLLKFREIFEAEEIEILGHSLKEDLITLLHLGIDFKNIAHDSIIAEYLLNSTQSDYDINNLTNAYFSRGYKDEEELLGKGKKKKGFKDLSEEELKTYFAFYLNAIYKLREVQINKIIEQEMTELYYEVELPLVEVLSSMELIGINTKESVLDEIGLSLNDKIKDLEEKIYAESGEEFNINSPKKLGEILFEKMGFPVIKKTKTGYSTAADVLEKLKGHGEIVDYVLEYRKLTKLKSTYVDGLKELINKDTGRIHSHFNQTVTSTGRISSTEPNLQNIPIRTEEGRLIRKSLLASEDHLLVDADYSQIELRVLADLSKDKNMIDAFLDDDDIHARTASEVFKVPLDEVTSLLRSQAKAVNFGIVYGISDYGLSQNLNIPRKEAGTYIDNYLEHYSGIKDYMDEEIKKGKEIGYVKTILNRRRYIPELNAKNFNIRSFGERVALNTPIQGSAADIIKIAMVKVYKSLKENNLKSKLILQIHDELIVDADKNEVKEVEKLMKDLMENAVKMDIPLKIDMQVGSSLYETK
ncbi:DNA polymerase I [Peptoniphilus stercorisuis]|uniref:DNA polymerase I n=1 Tax=Peptoniphilus stercorisuis TaxID=1436965 RepID=A0ABS4KAC3_9FIRM|nr:DNA polymerase I [Peptoniphilus stercorisuis]MBP2024730.1 DNA polymerase-1 [Peptoniphilus stercorisuis]